ncbi:hypothetical protein WH221_07045 [Chryseobacterium culicis]|uniref:PKD domain-containing protein n=1 Tax=Chryseobacterium culicis TaxID=680127 RepID=A0A2S9CZQ1_CHRCI|nr:hypothetical protein [Chryseobacterium culicis]PRB85995.1 hypothetical protein CQ022_07025 [Chryseobacterium culicis]PRB91748.1 hypothetical protein CQ033_00695 [Chryseobacterium culicis]
MKNQLSNIAVQYRKFSKGQYIEDPDQFNEFLDFFEDQDRLSRVLLQGVGIVCGLKPTLIYKNRLLSSIQLSQGVALTTDGDLLTLNNTSKKSEDLYMSDLKTVDLENKDFTHFKAYDNFKIKYPSFYEGNEQIELWELATAQEAISDFQPINNLTNLEDKYLLLYLEDYEKEIKPCRGVDCDNHGIQQIRNLKVLVTTASGINHILGEDGFTLPDPITGEVQLKRKDRLQPHPLFIEDIMEPVKQNRVILEQFVSEKKLSASDLKNIYIKALDKTDFGKVVFERMEAIGKIVGISTANHATFKASFTRIFNQESGFQYAYDVVKDLMDTYSEIIELLPKAFTKCLPDFVSFPKHIMLGKLLSDLQLDFSRHQFYNSPALDDDKATQKVKTLISRFNQQAGYFNPDNIVKNKERVKITPSQKLNPLSNKAIPFYYTVTEDFLKAWNFDKTSNRSSNSNLTFDTDWVLIGKFEKESPLNLNIDNYSFYNIEGHQGMDYQIAFEQIKEIKDKQQLGFDIMLLSLEELKGNKDLSKAYFNEYIEKNSGLEHKRGVKRGGTFILVYDSIKNPKVIADFSLPYICCTPKAIIKLSLPTSVICAESNPIPFTVSPMNGVVKANIGNGVKFINGQYVFDPKAVEEQFYGQEITFTVNGKPTDCSIKVISEPDIKVEVVEPVIYPGGDSTATIVNFKVSGANFVDYTYSWDFLGTDVWAPFNPDENGFVSYKYYNLDPSRIPTVRVKVIGNGCTQTVAVNLPLTKECPVISDIKYSVVDNGDGTQTFTFDWDLPKDLTGITGLNIYDSNDPGNGWHYESGSYSPRRSIKLPLGKYDIRFGLVGSCREAGNTVDLPGFDDIGIEKDQNNHPPTALLRWKDNSGVEDRLCRQSVCNFTIDVYTTDQDEDIATIQIFKSTDNGVTWSLFIGNLTGTTFTDAINRAGTQLYKAVVTDRKNNITTSNILSYKKENHPPAVSIRWNDTFGIEDRVCTQSACSYAVDVLASDTDGDIASVQIHKSTNNGATWNVFIANLTGTTFPDSINGVGTNLYKAVVVDGENNTVTSNILSYKNEYRPTVVINSISFPDKNCCPAELRTILAGAGGNQNIRLANLPIRKLGLKGWGSGANELLYFWSKLVGPDVILENVNEATLTIRELGVGKYKFQLLVKDANSDAFEIDVAEIIVE